MEQEISRFKMQLLRKMPFYGDVMMHLQFISTQDVPTAATNGKVVWYNPEFMKKLNPGERNYVLMHEVFHILLRHGIRNAGANRDQKIWNVACDLIVNHMLDDIIKTMRWEKIPFERPKEALFANIYNSETAENLYGTILEDQKNKKLPENQVALRKRYYSYGITPSDQYVVVENDIKPFDLSEAEMEMNDRAVKEIIRQALDRTRGDSDSYFVPEELYRLVEKKALNWQELLKEHLNQVVTDEASYTTPERKYLHMDLILPGHSTAQEELEEVWVFVDSSGSITREDMNHFLTQIYRIAKDFKCMINICYWDTKVTDVYRKVRREKDIMNCLPHHSGGTDINCVYDWMQKNRVKPGVMIILTDGYFGKLKTQNFKSRMKRKTILVLTENCAMNDEVKKVGKIAKLKED